MTFNKKTLNKGCNERMDKMSNLINLLSNVLTNSKPVQQSSAVRSVSNPFSSNPFVTTNNSESFTDNYAKNKPVRGGYYAGYYNGQPNIVGRKLFLEV